MLVPADAACLRKMHARVDIGTQTCTRANPDRKENHKPAFTRTHAHTHIAATSENSRTDHHAQNQRAPKYCRDSAERNSEDHTHALMHSLTHAHTHAYARTYPTGGRTVAENTHAPMSRCKISAYLNERREAVARTPE